MHLRTDSLALAATRYIHKYVSALHTACVGYALMMMTGLADPWSQVYNMAERFDIMRSITLHETCHLDGVY